MTRRLVVVTAGLSVPSSTRLLADQLADAVRAQVTARGEAVAVEFVELRELAQRPGHLHDQPAASRPRG